jgi:hypothetical protein
MGLGLHPDPGLGRVVDLERCARPLASPARPLLLKICSTRGRAAIVVRLP